MDVVDTKTRLRRAAEVLYAARGFRGISVRDITDLAEANLAAVNYHYGNKVGLITAVIEQHVGVLNRERLAHLDALLDQSARTKQPTSLEQILDAFFRPAVRRFIGPDQELPGLLARLHQDPTPELMDAMVRLFSPVFGRFSDAIAPHCPHLSREQILMRSVFLKGALLHVLADGDHLADAMTQGKVRFHDRDQVLRELIQFCAAGYRAPA